MVMPMMSKEQMEMIASVQEHTSSIVAKVEKGNDYVTIRLFTDEEDANQYIPQVYDAIIASTAQALYTLFGIKGTVESEH